MFTEKQKLELITAIKERGEIPLKFAYLGDGAKNWDSIAQERSSNDGINTVESILLRENIDVLTSFFQGKEQLNIIDIGCGNGLAVFPILEELEAKNIRFQYIAVDISPEILSTATSNVRDRFSCECTPFQLDFELDSFSGLMSNVKDDRSANLFLLLGSTLGNPTDRARIMSNIRESMTVDDYCIIGLELTNIANIQGIIPHYKGQHPENFVFFIPEALGINRADTSHDVTWNELKQQIEVRMVLHRTVKITVENESCTLEKGTQILLGISAKFTQETATNLLSEAGFRIEQLITSSDGGYLLAIIKPTFRNPKKLTSSG